MHIAKNCAAIAALALASAASANTLKLDFLGVGYKESVKITDTSLGLSNKSFTAGELKYKTLTGTNAAGFSIGQLLSTFCMDLKQTAADGVLTLVALHTGPVPGPAMGHDRAALLRTLYATSYSQALTSNAKAAAFQVAVWEIINEANFDASKGTRGLAGIDASSGEFKVTNQTSIRTQANTFLDSAFTAFKDGLAGFNLMAGVSPTLQDQIFIISVPMPSAAGLGLLGLAGICLRRRR